MKTKLFHGKTLQCFQAGYTVSRNFIFLAAPAGPEYKSLDAMPAADFTTIEFKDNEAQLNEGEKRNALRALAGGFVYTHRNETDPATKAAVEDLDKAVLKSIRSEVAAAGKPAGSSEIVQAQQDAKDLLTQLKNTMVTTTDQWLANNPKDAANPDVAKDGAWDALTAAEAAYTAALAALSATPTPAEIAATQVASEGLAKALKAAEKVVAPPGVKGAPSITEVQAAYEKRNVNRYVAETYFKNHPETAANKASRDALNQAIKDTYAQELALSKNPSDAALKKAVEDGQDVLYTAMRDAVKADVDEWMLKYPKDASKPDAAHDVAYDALEKAKTAYEAAETAITSLPTGTNPTETQMDAASDTYDALVKAMEKAEKISKTVNGQGLEVAESRNKIGRDATKWLDKPDAVLATNLAVRTNLKDAYKEWVRTEGAVVEGKKTRADAIQASQKLQAAIDAAQVVEKKF